MGWTTGQTTSQMVTVLKSAGALTDQAQCALHNLAHRPSKSVSLWGTLVQCTSGWNSGDPVFEYDSNPTFSNSNQTLAQVVTALVSAGALTDQATQVLHSIAWYPGQTFLLWGVMVQCTTGWNSGSALAYKYTTNPS